MRAHLKANSLGNLILMKLFKYFRAYFLKLQMKNRVFQIPLMLKKPKILMKVSDEILVINIVSLSRKMNLRHNYQLRLKKYSSKNDVFWGLDFKKGLQLVLE